VHGDAPVHGDGCPGRRLLLVILDLDRPFGGVARIDPTAMRAAEEQIGTTSFGVGPPCDLSGARR
jgi:hypothetical protein